MAKRIRPRITKVTPRDPDQDIVLQETKAILWANLPKIIKISVKLALDGNAQVNVKILDIVREMLREASSDRGNDVIDRITALRRASLEQVLDGQAEQDRQPADLGTAGSDGPLDADAGGAPGDLAGDVDPASPDL